jgi:hypothetical protein
MFAQLKDTVGDMLAKTTLFTIRSKFNSRLNVMLLKYLVNELGLKGVYICLERPSYYIEKLLKGRGVNLDNIVLLDAIHKVSGDQSTCEAASTELMETPFSKEFIERILGTGTGNGVMEIEDMDFMIIDSLSVLSCYIDDESLITLLEALSEASKIKTLMSLDRTCDSELYDKAKTLCDKEIRFNDDLTVETVEN